MEPRPSRRKPRKAASTLSGFLLPAAALAASCGVVPELPPLEPLESPVRAGAAPPARTTAFAEKTPLGSELRFHVFGEGPTAILLLGAIHGSETMSHRLLERFASHLGASRSAPGVTVVIATPVNPDGLRKRTRNNARGIDLNRNFPAKNWTTDARFHAGPSPLSEPEARFVTYLLETFRPRAVVSVHSALHCVNYDGPARELAVAMAERNGYPVRASIGYPTPGSLGSYVGNDLGIPIITLELPGGDSPDGFLGENLGALMEAVARVRDGRV